MKKINSKKGFTLVEIVLVVAVIIILALAVAINIPALLDSSRAASENIDSGINSATNRFQNSEAELVAVGF